MTGKKYKVRQNFNANIQYKTDISTGSSPNMLKCKAYFKKDTK